MSRGQSRRQQPPERRREPAIDFLGSQLGSIEEQLTAELSGLFRKSYPEVIRAYLARVCYRSTGTANVALCIRSRKIEARAIVGDVGHHFSRFFNSETFMDIVFLSADQEADLQTVCAPFYQSQGPAP